MRVLSGIQPTGMAHIGNYYGAIANWVREQELGETFYCVVDLHALTVEVDPKELEKGTLDAFATLIACGIDPDKSTLFVQSHVSAHPMLGWIMECTASMGELNRMTQFKDKGRGSESVKAGLFTYPALMAADILAYQADRVPVGEDQKQHLELARDLAMRFNRLYGDTFKVPDPQIPSVGARIMDLSDPTKKMSKSSKIINSKIYITDSDKEIQKKISRAVTDTEEGVVYDPEKRPGVANLIEIFSAVTLESPSSIAERYTSYGPLKKDLGEALISQIGPIRDRFNQLLDDKSELISLMRKGADRATEVAEETSKAARRAMGLVVLQ
ncbi:MAG: tryptophan--tRNA ligase [Actinomycetota bacterium]|nr:tryptophan--tRNA ligase [Actinomycetota bacterium]